MLSNQTFDLHSAQQRRKNSMPMVFDVPKVPNLPATKLTNIVPHRRGLSLDQRTNAQQSKTLSPQDEDTVSLTHGFKIYQQHLLREAQQQKQQARPGQQTSTQPFLNEDSSRQLLPKSCPEYDFNLSNQTRLVKQPTSLSNEIAKIPPGNVINTTNVRQSFDGTKFAGYFESFDFGPQKRIGNYQEENKANTIRMSNSRGISSTNSANPAGQEVPRRPSTPQNQTDTC